jgi:CRISPR/Cas system CSM-associated protein Csm4 (group 5 of RAMP superfamily)
MASPGIVVRLRPAGPWRIGPGSGARDSVDPVLHSDSLYSAVSCAMQQLGFADDWFAATAQAERTGVRLSSAFPYSGPHMFVPPPRHTWPPAATGKVRWQSAKLVPLSIVPVLLRDEDLDQDRWTADPVSSCLLPVGKHGSATPPFRTGLRISAPVDRVSGMSAQAFSSACLEFTQGSGMWCAVTFGSGESHEAWAGRIRSAFRLLADSGIGGKRSRGWGRSKAPQFQDVDVDEFLSAGAIEAEGAGAGYWLLSLFSPGAAENVDWKRGDYTVVKRSGRAEAGGGLKLASRLVEEGSVVFAAEPPVGVARNVAAEGSPHPVYRAGFAIAVPVPVRAHGVKYRSALAAAEPEPVPEPEPPPPMPEEPPVEEPPQEIPPVEEPPIEEPSAEEPSEEEQP